jgi:transcriptional regulator with XRE-family HTH domain
MTPADLKSIRHSLGLSAEAMAKLVRVESGRTVRRWEAGDRDIPGPVVVIAEGLRDSQSIRDYFGVSLDSAT